VCRDTRRMFGWRPFAAPRPSACPRHATMACEARAVSPRASPRRQKDSSRVRRASRRPRGPAASRLPTIWPAAGSGFIRARCLAGRSRGWSRRSIPRPLSPPRRDAVGSSSSVMRGAGEVRARLWVVGGTARVVMLTRRAHVVCAPRSSSLAPPWYGLPVATRHRGCFEGAFFCRRRPRLARSWSTPSAARGMTPRLSQEADGEAMRSYRG